MRLSLDLPLCATDITACTRCGNEVTFQHSWETLDGGRICLGCVCEAVEAYRQSTVADREIPY